MSVFKYLSADRVDVLRNATLRATQANALNDPFELRPFIENIATGDDLDGAMTKAQRSGGIAQKVYNGLPPEKRRLLSLDAIKSMLETPHIAAKLAEIQAQVRQEMLQSLQDNAERFRQVMYDKLGSSVGIVSFSEVADQVLMWAHYSSDHKGFVIEFDDTHAFFDRRRGTDDEFFHLRQVFYVSPVPVYKSPGELDGNRVMCMKKASCA